MNISEKKLFEIYGETKLSRARYEKAEKGFLKEFGKLQCEFFSAPGRMEIVGNHTDHNGGKVIAGSISMDTIAAAAPNGTNLIEIISEGYENKIVVDLDHLTCNASNDSKALLTGMIEAVVKFGYKISGFSAYVSTNVIAASGVSSSASFEMLICSIINYFFNAGTIDYVEYAKIGQYAENKYWRKASGLMDQLACAVGGIIYMDFADEVTYEVVPFDFSKFNYKFFLVNSKMNHAELSEEYSAVPNEMYKVAKEVGSNRLCDTSLTKILKNFNSIRKNLDCDRAIMRALHFFKENERVDEVYKAMLTNNYEKILACIEESGNSSWKYVQNCYVSGNHNEQSVALNLALSEMVNEECQGVCRVHGGGFSGVILEVVPEDKAEKYKNFMADMIGMENIYQLQIRRTGAIHV